MRIVPIVSAVVFSVACLLPALEFDKEHAPDVLSGLNVLAVGWSGIFAGIVSWYANPVWLFAVMLAFVDKPKLASIAALIAFLIGCTTFSLFGKVLPADEGNVTHMTLVKLLPGAYVWLASLLAPLFALFIRK
jgi:hypothetical protein